MATQKHQRDVQARLFKAIEEGDVEAVRGLLEVDPELASTANSEGASPLIWAAYYRQREVAELLMKGGVQPDIFEASALNLNDRVRKLLGSDRTLVDSYSYDGWTPLHLAAHFGSVDALRTLLANGASHRAVSRNSNGNQPLQAAAAGRQGQTVAILLQVGADVDMTKTLLDAGATVDVVAEGGMTPIQLAIEADHGAVVDLLETTQGKQGGGA